MRWAPRRVVVTGGAGFIGSHLVDRLLETTRADVVVLDDFSSGLPGNLAQHDGTARLFVVLGDVRDPAGVRQALEGADVVFHLAGHESEIDGPDATAGSFSTNVVGTFTVLREASALGVRRVVVTSCWEAYGEPLELPVCEDHPLLARTACGAGKAAAEVYCRTFRHVHGLSVATLRLGEVFGPRDGLSWLAAWIQRAAAGLDVEVCRDAELRDVSWVDDVVAALIRAAQLERTLPPVNVASGTGTRPVDAAQRIARLAGRPGRITLLPAGPGRVTRFVAGVDRLHHLLGLEPPLDPLAHLPELVAAARAARVPTGGLTPLVPEIPVFQWSRDQALARQ